MTQPTAATAPFGVRLREAMDRLGPFCAGLDPHRALVESWGLDYTPAGLERFALTCVEAFAGNVAVVKPQSAFFEVFGSRGIATLERVVARLQEAGTLVLLDVKRGDIGSTMGAYAEAYLADGSPLAVDAVTLSPYLGYGSLRPALDLAAAGGRGVFVLALTSNPEGPAVQHALRDGRSVAGSVLDGAATDNAAAAARGELGHVGVVVGATVGSALTDLGLDLLVAATPVLVPGFGAQGGTADGIRRTFAGATAQVLPSSSRGVLAAGPDPVRLREAARREADGLRALLG